MHATPSALAPPPHRPTISWRAILALLLSTITPFALAAQQGPTQTASSSPPALFTGRVNVDVVNVEVFVSDADGEPVVGLTAADFELLRDGKPMEITNFYGARRRAAATAGSEASAAPPANGAPVASPPQPIHLVVYVDHMNIRPANRTRVLENLRDFLTERASLGDAVMLVGYNRGVEVATSFTRDTASILAGLDHLASVAPRRTITAIERAQAMRQARGADFQTALGAVQSVVQRQRRELKLTTKALRETVRGLAGLPGRKAFFYISDGLPTRPGEALFHALDRGGGQAGSFDPVRAAKREDQSHLIKAIIREANSQQVTFYPIDARGAAGADRLNAAAGDSGNIAGNTLAAGFAELNFQEPLMDLAAGTGGHAVLNTFAVDRVLGETSRVLDSYYSLGFSLAEADDDAFHKLEVKVRDRRYRVRHRSGYRNKSEVERVGDRTLSALFLDANENPLGIAMDFGAPEKKRKNFLLPILIRIPFRSLTLLPRDDLRQGRLQIFLAVRDEAGRVADLHQQPYPVSVTTAQAAQAAEQDIGYSATLAVRPGLAVISVGVWDEVSGETSYLLGSTQVGNHRTRRNRQSPAVEP